MCDGINALNKKQIASLTAGYMALGKTYQEYRRQVAAIRPEKEKEILKNTTADVEDFVKMKSAVEWLCYEPISKRYFHATETDLTDAFYNANRYFALNGELSMNDFCSYLPGLDFTPDLRILAGALITLRTNGNITGLTSIIISRRRMTDSKFIT